MLSVLNADEELPEISAQSSVICFVPRSSRAVLKHGVDQSEELARSLSQQSGIPLSCALERIKGGKEQKKLSAAERVKNTKRLFALREGRETEISGKTVILVDDVVTTGASLCAAALALREAGVKELLCVALAQTPKKR
jgi:ComF family protein